MAKNRFPTFFLLAVVLLIVMGCQPLQPDRGRDTPALTVTTVQGGDVSALYGAVYDEYGQPRDGVEIYLEPGIFLLDPLRPFGGRLLLGKETILRSTLEMELDENGIPVVGDNGAPIMLTEGARIDGRELTATFFGMGVIEVGEHGVVERLVVDGGDDAFDELTSGIEITSQGTVSKVYATGHFIGARVRAGGAEAKGILEESLFAGNAIGMSVIAVEPTVDHPIGSDVHVEAALHNNSSVNNGNYNLVVAGGFSSDNNYVAVEASHNIFAGGASVANIHSFGGTDWFSSGSDNNVVEILLVDNLIADTDVGLGLSGGRLLSFDSSTPLEERYSSNNVAKVIVTNSTFKNNTTDIVINGSRSDAADVPAGGANNYAHVAVQGSIETRPNIEISDCFPVDVSLPCTSKAEVTFDENDD